MSRRFSLKSKIKRVSIKAVGAFGAMLLLCSLFITVTIFNRTRVEQLEMERLIIDKSMEISEVISSLLYKTEALSALVIQGDGEVENFERVSATICDDPAILNVLIAPDGVVQDVYPLEGNEAVLGLDFFSEGAGNREAMLAKETGELVFGGPFDLIQGGQALVGRLPVYIQKDGEEHFWGLVSVTLKYPQALEGVGLDGLEEDGYSYEIWRYSPDDGEEQVIASGAAKYNEGARYVQEEIKILNANWYFKIAPVHVWYQNIGVWLLIGVGLFVSFLVAFLVQSNDNLRKMKARIEEIANLDYLTGIYNRRYFMEVVYNCMAAGQRGCVMLFDIDKFKKINDTYGHSTGDAVLIDITCRVHQMLAENKMFARYGGEEFVVFLPDQPLAEAEQLAEQLRLLIMSEACAFCGQKITVTVSIGVAKIDADGNLEAAIAKADDAMYQAKQNGRNQVMVMPENKSRQ